MEGSVQEMVAVVSVTSVDLRLTDIGAAGPEVNGGWRGNNGYQIMKKRNINKRRVK